MKLCRKVYGALKDPRIGRAKSQNISREQLVTDLTKKSLFMWP
jgi:hypothetical protein